MTSALKSLSGAVLSGVPVGLIVTKESSSSSSFSSLSQRSINPSSTSSSISPATSSSTSSASLSNSSSTSTVSRTFTLSPPLFNYTTHSVGTVRTTPEYVIWSEIPLNQISEAQQAYDNGEIYNNDNIFSNENNVRNNNNTNYDNNDNKNDNNNENNDNNENNNNNKEKDLNRKSSIVLKVMISLLKLFHKNNRESKITDFDLFQNLCTCHIIEINFKNNEINDNKKTENYNLENFFSTKKMPKEKKNNFNKLYIDIEMEKESILMRNSIIESCVGCLSSVVKKFAISVLPHPLITKLNPSLFLEKEIEKINIHDLNSCNNFTIDDMTDQLFSNFISIVNQSTNKCINR